VQEIAEKVHLYGERDRDRDRKGRSRSLYPYQDPYQDPFSEKWNRIELA